MILPIHHVKILIVSSDRRTGALLLVNLSKFGYSVFNAENTAQGFALAKSNNPNIVICDVCPNINDTLIFCHTLRTELNLLTMPIILLASDEHSETKIAAWRHGVDTVITRPISIRMLFASIESSMQRIEQITADSMHARAAVSNCCGNSAKNYFQGGLDFLLLPELLQFLHYSKKSGSLVLTKQNASGTIVISAGEAVYARSDEASGEDAIYKMASWHNGTFSFSNNITTSRRNIYKSTMTIILECCTGINVAEPHFNISQSIDSNASVTG